MIIMILKLLKTLAGTGQPQRIPKMEKAQSVDFSQFDQAFPLVAQALQGVKATKSKHIQLEQCLMAIARTVEECKKSMQKIPADPSTEAAQ